MIVHVGLHVRMCRAICTYVCDGVKIRVEKGLCQGPEKGGVKPWRHLCLFVNSDLGRWRSRLGSECSRLPGMLSGLKPAEERDEERDAYIHQDSMQDRDRDHLPSRIFGDDGQDNIH